MSVDPFAPPTAGEASPFLTSFNTVSRALETLRGLPSPRGQLRASTAEVSQRLPVPHSSVLVRNETGAALPALSVVRLGETIQNVTTQQHDIFRLPAFEGHTPAAQSDQFAVLLEGAGVGKVSQAAIRGVAVCYVNVGNTAHKWAAPDPGSCLQLLSGETGPARILTTPAGTGRQLCAVLIDDRGDRMVRVEVDETPLNGDPATTLTVYSADEPTTSTPAVQFVVQNDDGAGATQPKVTLNVYPQGTGSAAATSTVYTSVGGTTTQVQTTYSLNSQTATLTTTESGGDIVHTWGAGQQLVASAATVTGFGGGVGAVVASSIAFTGQSAVNLTGITGYKWYRIVAYDLRSSEGMGTQLNLRTSTDGGANYDSGAGDYDDGAATVDAIGVTIVPADSGSWPAVVEMTAFNLAGTAVYKVFQWTHSNATNAATNERGARLSTADVDAIRFYPLAGTFAGSIIVYGYNN